MAYTQSFTTSTANQLLLDLSSFVSSNGWTVDLDAVYNTSYRRLHFHKGLAHYELYSTGPLSFNSLSCTGFNGGQAPAAQPGSSTDITAAFDAAGNPLIFVSTVGGIYMFEAGTNYIHHAAFFTVVSKVGVWSDGWGIVCGMNLYANDVLMSPGAYSTNHWATLYYNGAWTPTATKAGALSGNNYLSVANALHANQPNTFNRGILPLPITLFIYDTIDSSLKRPIGYLPGAYKIGGGDLFTIGETFTIGADTYIAIPGRDKTFGTNTYSSADLLFKLGA
jgi:hypothetical protein